MGKFSRGCWGGHRELRSRGAQTWSSFRATVASPLAVKAQGRATTTPLPITMRARAGAKRFGGSKPSVEAITTEQGNNP